MTRSWHGESTNRCSSRRRGPKVGKYEKSSHDQTDNCPLGSSDSRCARGCACQSAAQRLWGSWPGKPGDPRRHTPERPLEWRRLGRYDWVLDWCCGDRNPWGPRERSFLEHQCCGRWHAGQRRGDEGIRRRAAPVFRRRGVPSGASRLWEPGALGHRCCVHNPGARGAGLHERPHQATDTDDDAKKAPGT
jgi:hypothetical protein